MTLPTNKENNRFGSMSEQGMAHLAGIGMVIAVLAGFYYVGQMTERLAINHDEIVALTERVGALEQRVRQFEGDRLRSSIQELKGTQERRVPPTAVE